MHAASPPLLAWFRAGRRALPWRGPFPRDPYAVLVSEVMLQQTKVDRVVPIFERFMAAFPTLQELAAVEEEAVLAAFSGLGYYRRARLLHRAARAVAARAAWPEDRAGLRHLPGLGAYTSAAVAAFCFGGVDPPVDGNVARVAARVAGLELRMGSTSLLREAEAFARDLHRQAPTPEVWEAVMELGATVCTPAAPRCGHCPLAGNCTARRSGRQGTLPLPRPGRRREVERWVALWVEREDGRILLRRRREGVLAGLWIPPVAELAAGEEAESRARAMLFEEGLGGGVRAARPLQHTVTHRSIRIFPFVARVDGGDVREDGADLAWHDPEVLTVGTSTLTAKLAEECRAVPLPFAPAPEICKYGGS
jgi:A/G-specific adenine glycosylase